MNNKVMLCMFVCVVCAGKRCYANCERGKAKNFAAQKKKYIFLIRVH